MFLNCIEDVRIDSLTKPTLKRYIDKGDAICAPHFMEKYAKGEYDEKNLLNVGYRYLFHHKDFLCDDYITETYPDITKLLSATPFEYIKDVFGIYKKELQQFVRECYQDTDCATESGATGNLDALLGDSDEEESGDLQELSKDIKFDEETLSDTKSSNSEPIKQYLEKTEPSFQPISTVLADGIEVMGKVSIHNTVETNVSDNSTFGYATLVVDES